MNKNLLKPYIFVLGMAFTGSAFAIENAKVLPKGVRNINIKNARASVSEKSDAGGVFRPIAEPLKKDMTFRKIVEGEKGINQTLLKAFLVNKFDESESLGSFSADMRGNISVLAGVFSYGITDNLTLAIGIPYYQAKMHVRMGFHATSNANRLINYLNKPENNQTAKAEEVAEKITNAVRELNNKLTDNGYDPIYDWNKAGIGDITVAAKYRFLNTDHFRLANALGVVAPTGYAGDPNVLISVPFGTGTWGIFDTIYIDEMITNEFWFNQYFKYTYQAPMKKQVRLKTEDESITVPEEKIRVKLANRWETGFSAQYEGQQGIMLASGISYTGKRGDSYDVDYIPSRTELEKNTNDWSTYWETKIGYQSIPAFLRKEFPVPFNVTFELKKHLSSANTVIKDLYTFDFNLFF